MKITKNIAISTFKGDDLIKNERVISLEKFKHEKIKNQLPKKGQTLLDSSLKTQKHIKLEVERLAEYYQNMGLLKKADRLLHCGDYLELLADQHFTKLKIKTANFCRDSKVCPFCAQRKQKQDALALSTMVKAMPDSARLKFVTLTIPNVWDNLGNAVDLLNQSFKKLINYNQLKKVYLGAVKSLEVTYSPNTGYHPHLHVLFAFRSSIDRENWIRFDDWLAIWRDCTGLPISRSAISIKKSERTKPWKQDELAEEPIISHYDAVFGYLSKQKIKLDNVDLDAFEEIYRGTFNKKMLTYHGLFRELKKAYSKGDLDHLKPKKEAFEAFWSILCRWSFGLKEYHAISIQEIKNPADHADQQENTGEISAGMF